MTDDDPAGTDGSPAHESGAVPVDDVADLPDLAPGEWPALDPRTLAALEARGFDVGAVPDEALPTDRRCPRCHWPVFRVTMAGPGAQVLGPCGCRIGGPPL